MQLTVQQSLLDDLNAMWKSFAIQAAAQFDFATLIGEGSMTTTELAEATGTQERWVYRVLRFLAAHGVFAEVAPRTFTNTARSLYLCDDIPGSLRAMARMMGSNRVRQEWCLLEHTMQTGIPSVELLCGKGLYAHLDEHPEEGDLFDAAITSFSTIVDEAIATTYDFSVFKKVVDIGGGRGSLMSAICTHHPSVQGVLFERPSVIERLQEAGGLSVVTGAVDLPIELVAGDFFDQIPQGIDAYVLKEVLHNWSDRRCVEILTNCRRSMHAGSVVLVCEQLVPSNNEGAFAKGLDLMMGLEQQGGERTQEEFQTLYEAAGFRLTRVLQTPSPHCIFEGVIR